MSIIWWQPKLKNNMIKPVCHKLNVYILCYRCYVLFLLALHKPSQFLSHVCPVIYLVLVNQWTSLMHF